MTVSNNFKLDLATIETVDITQIGRQQWGAGITDVIERGSGGIRPKFAGIGQQQNEISFSTTQLASILGVVPLMTGVGVSQALNTYFKHMSQTSHTARASLAHVRGQVNYGMVFIERITLEQNQPATADVIIAVGWDGTNAPIIYAGSLALDATEIANDEVFGVGPAAVNGVAILSVQRATIESGIELEKLHSASEVWPSFVGIKQTEPKITIETFEMSHAATAGVAGTVLNGTGGITLFARKFTKNMAGGLARVADITAQHISFTMANGRYHVEPQGDGNDPVTLSIMGVGTSAADGTPEIAVNTAIAIT